MITVSIAPFKYFIEEIAGDDFTVNIMVPPGSNPHIYEPYPEQITRLRRSEAYISNGFLGFEETWLDRFYEINKTMIKISLGDKINPIASGHQHEGRHAEGADPHYWVSPKCAKTMASSVKDLLCGLNPAQKQKYELNYNKLLSKITGIDSLAGSLFQGDTGRTFMIYHPNLGYLARDYGLVEVPVEFEGKEPPPSRLKELIDLAMEENISTIFVQKEYDSRNAKAIAKEIGGTVTVIDPLSEEWLTTTKEIITELHKSFTEN
jgi:zinc transport system substrate-binding protein